MMMLNRAARLLHMCRKGRIATAPLLILFVLSALPPTPGAAEPVTVAVVGDSLSAGYDLAAEDAFPAQLQRALNERGHDVHVVGAAVSGDTTAGGRARLGWVLGDGPDAVIVELGANDALRGLDPTNAYENLKAILQTLADRGIPALLAGMRAPPNMGDDYAREFEAVYRRLADEFDIEFYPFFLEGVAARPELNLADGMHPTAEGIGVIVSRIMPTVEALLARVGRSGSGS